VLGRERGRSGRLGRTQANSEVLAGIVLPGVRWRSNYGGEGVGNQNGHKALRVLLADQDAGALKVTAGQLRDLGHTPTEIAVSVREAVDAIARDEPDLTLVVLYGDDEYALDLIEEINAFSSGPVIALLDREDPDFVAEAAERGIFAYARQETADSIQSAIEVAMRRWREHHDLAEQVERLESALERRTLIERAKGILMERHNLDDRAAFQRLREHARSTNRTVVDVAAAVADGHALLPKARD
jgi:AmiR/NasT family two-component response regulator